MKRPNAFLKKVAALIPPPKANLVRYFGVLAPNAKLRKAVVPQPARPKGRTATPLPAQAEAPKKHPLPWAELLKRSFGLDVLACDRCGGRRRVVACVFSSAVTAEILTHLHLPARPLPRAPARAPPQLDLAQV